MTKELVATLISQTYRLADGTTLTIRLPEGGSVEGTIAVAPKAGPAPPANGRGRAREFADWCRSHGCYDRAEEISLDGWGCSPEDLAECDVAGVADRLRAERKAARVDGTPAPPREPEPEPGPEPPPAPPAGENGEPRKFGTPTSGGALYAWAKKLEEAYRPVNVVSLIDREFVDGKGRPKQWKEWSKEQVLEAAAFVAERAESWPGYDGQFKHLVWKPAVVKAQMMGVARQLLMHQGHDNPSYVDAQKYLRDLSVELRLKNPGGSVLEDLRDCHDRPLLEGLLTLARRELDAVEAIKGEGVAS